VKCPGREAGISPTISKLPAVVGCYLGVHETLAFCKPDGLWRDSFAIANYLSREQELELIIFALPVESAKFS